MIAIVIYFVFFLIVLWLLTMVYLWRKEEHLKQDTLAEIKPVLTKSTRLARRALFWSLRRLLVLRDYIGDLIAKGFFKLFPKAQKAFEKKDELIGLDHGPSSYFLKSISEDRPEVPNSEKKNRRKRKNV